MSTDQKSWQVHPTQLDLKEDTNMQNGLFLLILLPLYQYSCKNTTSLSLNTIIISTTLYTRIRNFILIARSVFVS